MTDKQLNETQILNVGAETLFLELIYWLKSNKRMTTFSW